MFSKIMKNNQKLAFKEGVALDDEDLTKKLDIEDEMKKTDKRKNLFFMELAKKYKIAGADTMTIVEVDGKSYLKAFKNKTDVLQSVQEPKQGEENQVEDADNRAN